MEQEKYGILDYRDAMRLFSFYIFMTVNVTNQRNGDDNKITIPNHLFIYLVTYF